jgi:hypothetical protein
VPGFIGTLAIQQSTRSPREESQSVALAQFDFKLKLCRQILLRINIMPQNSRHCNLAASLWERGGPKINI